MEINAKLPIKAPSDFPWFLKEWQQSSTRNLSSRILHRPFSPIEYQNQRGSPSVRMPGITIIVPDSCWGWAEEQKEVGTLSNLSTLGYGMHRTLLNNPRPNNKAVKILG